MSLANTVVFLGPTMPVAQAQAILPAQYHAPAKMGDIYALLGKGVQRMLLIDGIFHNQPSVWQRELLAAMREGVEVYGSSSMGALRAAELHHLGMRGHGQVFTWYQAGLIDGDDEVAVLHGEADSAFRLLSEPLVNIRATLAAAAADGLISQQEHAAMVALAKATFYPKRSFPSLLAAVRQDQHLAPLHDVLQQYFREKRVDIKQLDALSLLAQVAKLDGNSEGEGNGAQARAKRPAPMPLTSLAHPRVRLTCEWDDVGYVKRVGCGRTYGVMIAEIDALRRRDAEFARLTQSLALRWFALEFLRERALEVPDAQVNAVAAKWQAQAKVGDLASWLGERGMLASEHQAYLREQATLEWAVEHMPASVASDWSPARLDAIVAMAGGQAEGCMKGGQYSPTAARAAAIKAVGAVDVWPSSFATVHFLAAKWAEVSNIHPPPLVVERRLPAMLGHWHAGLAGTAGLDRRAYEDGCRALILTSWLAEATPAYFGYRYDAAAGIFRALLHGGANLQQLHAGLGHLLNPHVG